MCPPSGCRATIHGVTCDPNTLQWIAVIGPTIATIAAVVGVVFAARSARVAALGLEAQTRPLLTDVSPEPFTGQVSEIVSPGARSSRGAMSGEILADHEEGWLDMPVRNTGRGMAQIERVDVELAGARKRPVKRAAGPSRRHVQPGGDIRLHVELGRASLEYETFRRALTEGAGIIVQAVYTDFAGQQRQTSFFELERSGGAPWRVTDVWTIPASRSGRRSGLRGRFARPPGEEA